MSENKGTPQTDLRVRRSRKHLTDAMCALMRERPLQKITVRAITERAMVNRSTFYAHFADKHDLFRTAIGERMRHDLGQMLDRSAELSEANLRKLARLSIEMVTRISTDCQRTSMPELAPVFINEMQRSIHEILLSWAGQLRMPPLEQRAIATHTAGAVFGTAMIWAHDDNATVEVDSLVDQIIPLILHGIGTQVV